MRQLAVVFDFDNTLAHTSGTADLVIARILRAHGCTLSARRLLRIIRRARNDRDLVLDALGRRSAEAYDEIVQAHVAIAETLAVDRRIVAMLSEISRWSPIYVCSGRDSVSLRTALSRTGTAPFVTSVVSGDATCVKPRPGMLRRLIAQSGAAYDVVYVGDLLTDYWAAINAECSFLGAAWFHDRLPSMLPKCGSPAELEGALLERRVRRSRRLSRRAAAVRPNNGYSRNPSA